jgi:hypothetical protein
MSGTLSVGLGLKLVAAAFTAAARALQKVRSGTGAGGFTEGGGSLKVLWSIGRLGPGGSSLDGSSKGTDSDKGCVCSQWVWRGGGEGGGRGKHTGSGGEGRDSVMVVSNE